MKKLKLTMRVMAIPTELKSGGRFGANHTIITRPMVYTAMQQGVVTRLKTCPTRFTSIRHTVAKYFSRRITAGSLPPDDERSVMSKIPEDESYFEHCLLTAVCMCLKARLIFSKWPSTLIDGGRFLRDVDKEAFRSLISDLYDSVAADCGGEKNLELINALG
jgi:hypothetical protein